MKKLLASVLCLTMVMSLAACNSKKPEQTTTAVTETTAETSEPASTEPSASATETTVKTNPALEYVKDRVEKLSAFKIEDEDDEEAGADEEDDEDYVFHFPELQIKSSYADSINKEMKKIFEGYKKEYSAAVKGKYTPDLYSCDFIAYLTKEGVLSLVFVEGGANDNNEYHVYNIDVKTGEKVDNARLAQIAGVSSIRKAAMDALQNLYNNDENHNHTLKNYKIVKKNGKKLDAEEKAIEKAFSEKRLNDKMKIGLTDEGKMFFISEFETGAGEFFGMYDGNGNDLYSDDNPCFVGERYPDDDEGDGEEDDLPDVDED
ncbi:MAG: hypothetical protein IKW88_07475 [Clostridiales bacterium]|nr:hypothetical protein [Clostridiales bacterium]